MTSKNFHSCSLRNITDFVPDTIGQKVGRHKGKPFIILFGQLKGDGIQEQSYRYNRRIWTAAQAREHCNDNDGHFQPASGGQKSLENRLALEKLK